MPHRDLRPVIERLFEKVKAEGDCLVFTGARCPKGYGHISTGPRGSSIRGTHRVAWELLNGPIPPGIEVAHRCDNPPCLHPDHLFLATHRENMRDMRDKGRGKPPSFAKLTAEQVRAIRKEFVPSRWVPSNAAELAERYGVAVKTVNGVVRGESWQSVK